MSYDFDECIDRRGTGSLKWDVAEGELPMWVADMDFRAAPEITAAIRARAEHGVFGYSVIPEEWYGAYIRWWGERHRLDISRESLTFCTGVVPAISSAVRRLTAPGEGVAVLTPVYNIFFNSIRNNGRFVADCPLRYGGGSYSIDFDALERVLADPQVTLLILCNPHNPVGRIWSREELAQVGELCARCHVAVISDEIHCDLTDPGTEYVPFASVDATCRAISATCLAPTKAFNIAGLQTAAVMADDPALRHKLRRALNTDEVAEPNAFAVDAAIAAFTRGGPWLDALRSYLCASKDYAAAFAAEHLPQLRMVRAPATYLLWFDCSAVTADSVALCRELRARTGLYVNEGREYGGNGGSFFRMNVACPRSRVADGLERLRAFFG